MINIDRDNLVSLLGEKTIKDTSIALGCSVETVRKSIKRYGITHTHKGRSYAIRCSLPDYLTTHQNDVFVGCMLGDGHIDKDRGRFRIEQKADNEDYVKYLIDVFHPFSSTLKIQAIKKPANGKKVCFYTYKHDIFEISRANWYNDGMKVVPRDIKINKTVLLHWYCQDGSNTYGFLKLHTNGFSEDDVSFLSIRLKEDLDIDSHIVMHYENPVIAIGTRDNRSNYKLVDMIREDMIWKCFQHKIMLGG